MPRTAPYLIPITDPLPDGLTYALEIVPADLTPLVTTTPVEVSYRAQEGVTMPGSRGWGDGPIVGFPTAETRKVMVALNEMPSDLASYLVSSQITGGTLTIGSYTREIVLPNLVALWSDRGKASGVRTTLEGVYTQRPVPTQAGTIRRGGTVTLEMELVDVTRWCLETMRAGDVEAELFAGYPGTTDRWVYQDVWTDGAGRTYTVRHGDRYQVDGVVLGTFRQYTLHELYEVFDAIAAVATRLLTLVARRSGASIAFASTDSTGNALVSTNNTRSHWLHFPQTGNEDWQPGIVEVPIAEREIITRVALNTSPTVPFHGFLYSPPEGEDAPEDCLASWDTVWDFLSDEAKAAGAVPHTSWDATLGWDATIRFMRMLEPPATLALSPADIQSEEVEYEIGAPVFARATGIVPASTSNDAEPVDIEGQFGAAGDEGWSTPRGFHTLPIAWPQGDRYYNVENPIGGVGAGYANVNIFTQAVNCLTLYHRTTVGGLLSAAAPVRLHHASQLQIFGNTIPVSYGGALPTPDPIDDYESDSETGDTDLGTPYLEAVAGAQRACCILTAKAVMYLYGEPQTTTYTAEFRTRDMLGGLGARLDPATWPSGNELLDGATYLGALPGGPYVANVEDDLLGEQLATVRLVAHV